MDALSEFLGIGRCLLVVDNFEHVLEAGSFLSRLLESSAGLTALATSREPLALTAEERYAVAPLQLPYEQLGATLIGLSPAVSLFVDRAHARDPEFALSDDNAAAVVAICRRLDGLPLAIELAAARTGLLSAPEIANRLDDLLSGLGRGPRDAPPRQQTLRATIDWSVDLLDEGERTLFDRMGVFAGGSTLEALSAVTGGREDIVERLVEKNLILRRRLDDGTNRLAMLETVRAYAHERLASRPDQEATYQAHCDYYVRLLQQQGGERGLLSTDREVHLRVFEVEHANVLGALEWARSVGDGARLLRLCAGINDYWGHIGRNHDVLHWAAEGVRLPGATDDSRLTVEIDMYRALALHSLERRSEAADAVDAAERLARELDDPRLISRVLQVRAAHAIHNNELELGARYGAEAVEWATIAGDHWEIAISQYYGVPNAADLADLRERVAQTAPLLRAAGHAWGYAGLFVNAAYTALHMGAVDDAKGFAERAEPALSDLGAVKPWIVQRNLFGFCALLAADVDRADRALRESMALAQSKSVTIETITRAETLLGLAGVAGLRGDAHEAALLYGAAAVAHKLDWIVDAVDACFVPARLESDVWEAGVDEGSTWTVEQAIAHVLAQAGDGAIAGHAIRDEPRVT